VITTPASVAIQPYNRLVSELTSTPEELVERLRAAGAQVEPVAGQPAVPAAGGSVQLYTAGQTYAVTLPAGSGTLVENLDHALVERVLLRDALGLDPGDKRINYVGGDYPAQWLAGEVDAGRAELAILIAPVTVDDFVAVNLARQKLPRKSPWFTPKARGGLVLAELGACRSGAGPGVSSRSGRLRCDLAVRGTARLGAANGQLTDCAVCASTWDPTTPATS